MPKCKFNKYWSLGIVFLFVSSTRANKKVSQVLNLSKCLYFTLVWNFLVTVLFLFLSLFLPVPPSLFLRFHYFSFSSFTKTLRAFFSLFCHPNAILKRRIVSFQYFPFCDTSNRSFAFLILSDLEPSSLIFLYKFQTHSHGKFLEYFSKNSPLL